MVGITIVLYRMDPVTRLSELVVADVKERMMTKGYVSGPLV